MPARARTIGPDASVRFAGRFRTWYEDKGLSMPKIAGLMMAAGHDMSAAVINNIVNGVPVKGQPPKVRLITIDEAVALSQVLGIPREVIMDWMFG